MRKYGVLGALLVCSVLCFSMVAPAVVMAQGVIDAQPAAAGFVNIVLSAGVTIATGLLGLFVYDAKARSMRQSVQAALEAAAAYAVVKVKDADWAKLDIKSKLVAEGVNYMFTHVPKALKFFGITPDKLANELAQKVLARLAYHAPSAE